MLKLLHNKLNKVDYIYNIYLLCVYMVREKMHRFYLICDMDQVLIQKLLT